MQLFLANDDLEKKRKLGTCLVSTRDGQSSQFLSSLQLPCSMKRVHVVSVEGGFFINFCLEDPFHWKIGACSSGY